MSAATVESTAKHERREAAPRPLGLLIAGLIVLGVSIVFAVLVLAGDGRPSGLQTVDDGWRRLVGAAPGAEQSPIAMFFQYAGSLMVIISAGPILILVLLALGRWRSTIFAFLLLAFSGTVLNLFAKQLITRERPTDDVSLGLYGPLV